MKVKSEKPSPKDEKLGASLHQRLKNLASLLKVISEHLSESNAAAKAYAMVRTVLMLEMINYDVMNDISHLMIEVDACNIFPTDREKRVPRQTIVDATELAEDILADLPIGYRVVKQDGCHGTYAVYGSWDANLPDISTLIANYEEALSEDMEGDS